MPLIGTYQVLAVRDIATTIVFVELMPVVTVPKSKLAGVSCRFEAGPAAVTATDTGAETLAAYVLSPE